MSAASNMLEGSDDVYVHKFTISLGGKTLFHDCKLSLAHGRRYGLVGESTANAHADPTFFIVVLP